MARLPTDADVERVLSPQVAVAAARRALADAYRGAPAAPPRVSVDVGRGDDAISLDCSTGLAGSEVVPAQALLERA